MPTLSLPQAIDAFDLILMASSIPTEELVEVRNMLRQLKAAAMEASS